MFLIFLFLRKKCKNKILELSNEIVLCKNMVKIKRRISYLKKKTLKQHEIKQNQEHKIHNII